MLEAFVIFFVALGATATIYLTKLILARQAEDFPAKAKREIWGWTLIDTILSVGIMALIVQGLWGAAVIVILFSLVYARVLRAAIANTLAEHKPTKEI